MASSANNHSNSEEVKGSGRLRSIILLLLTVVLGIALTVALFHYREEVAGLGNYGYLGAFFISLVTSATVILPVPGIVALAPLGATLNPVLVGLAGATGAIIGEMTGFLVGFESHGALLSHSKLHLKLEEWMKRWGSWALFVIAAVPLPLFDVAGIIAGALRFPLWKFLLIGWAGKCIKFVFLVVAGAWGWETILNFVK